jgi:predicted PurR-regulated permease PerM
VPCSRGRRHFLGHRPAYNLFTTIVYSLCIGNFLSPPMQWPHALYEKPAPYDWIIFLVLLCIVTVPVYLLSSMIVWLIAVLRNNCASSEAGPIRETNHPLDLYIDIVV